MAATSTELALNTPAPDFRLPATDGRIYALADIAGANGTVIAFICNHCPYVIAVIDRLVADARLLAREGVGFACVCSNDAAAYPDDSFEKMKVFAQAHDLPFPYLRDETQSAARALERFARRIFSATTAIASSNTGGASTRAARRATGGRAARAGRSDARRRRDRAFAHGTNRLDRLFDQMESARLGSRAQGHSNRS